uniref:Uncharacterized protein n=1 Tax=Arundo donax TaxID=35708 RepID=A0A0A9BS06_ARUDO
MLDLAIKQASRLALSDEKSTR